MPVLDKRSFDARDNDAYSEVEAAIKELKLDEHTTDEILSKVVAYMTTISDIYFALGMKAGATLVIKLTDNLEKLERHMTEIAMRQVLLYNWEYIILLMG